MPPQWGGGRLFDTSAGFFFVENDCNTKLKRKVKKSIPRWEMNFSSKRKNGRFSLVPAGTRSIVILGHFFDEQTVPSKVVEDGPKLRVLILLK